MQMPLENRNDFLVYYDGCPNRHLVKYIPHDSLRHACEAYGTQKMFGEFGFAPGEALVGD